MPEPEFVRPDWPAPDNVRAAVSTRIGGVSEGPYAGFNLAAHVGDRAGDVAENRQLLARALELPNEPYWLRQQHAAGVREARAGPEAAAADASHAARAGAVCVVQTADCLPVLLCSRRGDWVAAAHAGWRGLAADVLAAVVRAYPGAPGELLAWFGPAIGAPCCEVDAPVRAALGPELAAAALRPGERPDRWLLDLEAAAAWRLARAGVANHYGGGLCTYRDRRRFYSYRRDGRTGRMAALIWLER